MSIVTLRTALSRRRRGVQLFSLALASALVLMLTPRCEVLASQPVASTGLVAGTAHTHCEHADVHGGISHRAHDGSEHGLCTQVWATAIDLLNTIPAVSGGEGISPSAPDVALPSTATFLLPPSAWGAPSVWLDTHAPPRPSLPLYLRLARLRN